MWFKNIKIFRLSSHFSLSAEAIESLLEKARFTPGSSLDMVSMGWVSPTDEGGLVHALAGQYLISLRVDKKLLPSSVVNQVARARAADIEEQQGYKPGRKQMKEIKERVTEELLPKAFSVHRDTRVWIDTRNHWLAIDAAAGAKADEVIGMLAKALDPFPATPLYTEISPASAMTQWLLENDGPGAFTIDQDTELRSTSENRATVRYVRHSIETEEVRKHVQNGKQCTRLAMTWADRVSFVLTDALDIKRISPLDVLKENQEALNTADADAFDTDFALMTGELGKMLNDLVDALGGEKKV
ncbi:recombination-associated protein RdgC [Neopusillimonas maritima]|jgi:recombination associated protein RdgC|uniref:Recombination-associated protein RdgC n=1 Tax=Neopusillimonas maritima TaxID=2026239 RepID=A0ABX9MUA0_9BURK|nr:recombination-associated protein RdgC [Neopusillimonas maritima]RII82046.1 recombination-associated protein RdgC [Neopusillimonas maritima]